MTSANSALYSKKRVARHMFEILVLTTKRPFLRSLVDFSVDRVYDPIPIPHDQSGILANATTTTDTIPAERTLGMEEVMIELQRESLSCKARYCVCIFNHLFPQ